MYDFMIPPKNASMAPTGPTWLDAEGIIITINHSTSHTLEEAKENLVITKQVGAGKARPLLVDLTLVKSMSKEAREEYSTQETQGIVTAVALITQSNIGRMVANLFIGFNQHVVPVKMFNDPIKAKEWLLQYR